MVFNLGVFMLQIGVILRVFMFSGGQFEEFFMGDEQGAGGCTQNGLRKYRFILICR